MDGARNIEDVERMIRICVARKIGIAQIYRFTYAMLYVLASKIATTTGANHGTVLAELMGMIECYRQYHFSEN